MYVLKNQSLAIFSWESLSRYHLSQSKAWCWSGPTQDWQLLWNCLFQLRMNCSNVAGTCICKKEDQAGLESQLSVLLLPRQKAGRPLFCCFDISSCHDMSRQFFSVKKGTTLEGPGSLERWAEVGHRFQWQYLAHFRFQEREGKLLPTSRIPSDWTCIVCLFP